MSITKYWAYKPNRPYVTRYRVEERCIDGEIVRVKVAEPPGNDRPDDYPEEHLREDRGEHWRSKWRVR